MRSIVSLVTEPQVAPLEPTLVREVERLVAGRARWLAAEEAAEIEFDRSPPPDLPTTLATILGDRSIDWAIMPAGNRRKRLLLADMDSTMITIECVDELAVAAGVGEEVAAVTRRAMNGELDFVAALLGRVALLAGLPATAIDEIRRDKVKASPGAAMLVATMRAAGARTILVSGGFRQFTRHVRRDLGLDADEANDLEERDGKLTGGLVPPIRDARSKMDSLLRHSSELQVPLAHTIAIGDGANDIPMLKAAGLGIAYRGHASVREAIACRIDHTALTTALFYQGFERTEFVEPAAS